MNKTILTPLATTFEEKSIDMHEIEMAIFAYTNDERKKAGKSCLMWDDKLADIARDHSQDMVNNNYFSHDNLRGEDPPARAKRHGYPVRKYLGLGWYSDGIAENIGKMPTGNVIGVGYVGRDENEIAYAHVKSWMQCPDHRSNILEASYDKLGVGVAYGGQCYIATQNFW